MKHIHSVTKPAKAECAIIDFLNGILDLLDRLGIDISGMINKDEE